jgi:hypothetical protein
MATVASSNRNDSIRRICSVASSAMRSIACLIGYPAVSAGDLSAIDAMLAAAQPVGLVDGLRRDAHRVADRL